MTKALNLKDLKSALAPLLEALVSNRVQTTEMHAMITNMTTKIDLMDQSQHEEVIAPKKAAPKKRVSKSTDATPVKNSVKRKPKKKGVANVDEPDESDASEYDDVADESESDSGSESKKKPVKQVKQVKPIKKKKSVIRKTRLPNKWEFFSAKFNEDETYFSTYITEEKIVELHHTHEESLAGLTGEDLRKARRAMYYQYMKNNHDITLKAMKEAYHEEITTQQPVLATKEE
jgi:hypothetical protein